MTHKKNKITMLSALAALTLCPALVLAQTGSAPGGTSGSASGSGTTGSGTTGSGTTGSGTTGGSQGSQGSNGSQKQGSQNQGSQKQGSQGSNGATQSGTGTSGRSNSAPMIGGQTPSGMGGAQQSIDPSEVQKVFGTDASLVDLRSLDTEEVRRLQQTLQERGHYRGQMDGILGPQTRAGLNALLAEQYALNQRLISQGQIAGQLASSLGMDAQGVSPVSGVDAPSDLTPSPASGTQRSNRSGTSGSSNSRPSTSPHPSGSSSSPSTSGSSSGSSSSGSSTNPNVPR